MISRTVITRGLGRRALVTRGYGGLAESLSPPGEDTDWTEHSCNPTTWIEQGCNPVEWDDGRVYPIMGWTPDATGRERSPGVAEPPPPVLRLGTGRPGSTLRDQRWLMNPLPGSRLYYPRPSVVEMPGPCYRERSPVGETTPTQETVVYGYAEIEDTWLDEALPNLNYGGSSTLRVRTAEIGHNVYKLVVLRVPNHGIPQTATISSAILSLQMSTTPTDERDVAVQRLLQDFDEMTATWNTGWNVAGCQGEGTDYTALNESVFHVNSGQVDYEIDVLDIVSDMVSDGDTHLLFRIDMVYYAASHPTYIFKSTLNISGGYPELTVIYQP